MTPQLELSAIAWALVGYVALQIGLNMLSVYRVSRAQHRALLTLVNAFQANVLNALYFLGIAVAFHLLGIANEATPPARMGLHALLGLPVGIALWFALTLARKLGQKLFGRGDLALAEEAIIRHAPTPRLQGWGVMNLVVIQPLGRELFLRGLLLPAVVEHKGWAWGIAATLIVELLLRLNIVWLLQTLLYAGVMLGLYYLTGNALCGLTAAMTAGAIQAAVLLKRAVAAELGSIKRPS
jgi:hypothetical protein